jgi:hypothetical protein
MLLYDQGGPVPTSPLVETHTIEGLKTAGKALGWEKFGWKVEAVKVEKKKKAKRKVGDAGMYI